MEERTGGDEGERPGAAGPAEAAPGRDPAPAGEDRHTQDEHIGDRHGADGDGAGRDTGA
ncbi:hypothetical protein HLB32_17565, partial [Streptomyces cacaoi]|nr:hypothetical protein [Streptomyces cacaoi]